MIRRATDLSPEARLHWPDSKIVSLLVGDLNRIAVGVNFVTDVFILVDVAGLLTLLLIFLGVSALPGVAVLLLLVCVDPRLLIVTDY